MSFFVDCFISVLSDNFFPNIGKNCFKFVEDFALEEKSHIFITLDAMIRDFKNKQAYAR
jgi:hypothetical protein